MNTLEQLDILSWTTLKAKNFGDCWKSLTAEQKQDVVRQTAGIIDQLQSVIIPEPGPIGGGPCRGRFFTEYSAGPFKSASEMEGWFNHKLEICKHYKKAPLDTPAFKFTKFVLVHQDISPRNLILGTAGQLWLVDWGHAGAYPPVLEQAAIADQYRFPEFNKMILDILPKRDAEVRQLLSIGYGLTVAAWA